MLDLLALMNVVCFFFQAEDGIRPLYVTGVQTCALPISADHLSAADDAAVPANGASVTDWTIAADEAGAEDGPGAAHWSNTDDLSNTAEWNRTADWNSTGDWHGSPRERDGSSREWDGSASHDS